MLLSQFTAGLKPTVRAQILIENPGKFQEAVEVADRIEKAQNMLTPNINVVSSLTGNETNFEKLMKVNTETYTKTIDLFSKQLEKMNERLDRLENEKERKESSSRNFKWPNFVKQTIKCFFVKSQGTMRESAEKRWQKNNILGVKMAVVIGEIGGLKIILQILEAAQTSTSRG
ncbi:hypothetical protein AVEN_29648-1 [Araneus ventricosus]|uniref:Uncharacterized protein n=1 Tax=Araneus ventricosus TaxID=182803 RepID=A0A4Y2IUH5_ARAVE|nr:hypothetical protein AVEN_271564-1 [Araneus ventricosus]GBM81541.1 hypothetical protein AVEN_29648-1 [Araneus ventricosus]